MNKLIEGETLFAEGMIEEAEKCFLSVVESDLNNKEAYNNLGVIAFQKEDTERAIDYFTRSLEIDPLYRDTIVNYINLLRTLDQLQIAVPFLEKILEANPDDKEIIQLLEDMRTSDDYVDKEEDYYTEHFTKNSYWSKPTLNHDEMSRWEKISNFLYNIYQNKTVDTLEILDVGCGRGWLTNLCSRFGKAQGVEPVANVVNWAKKLFPESGFKVGTADTLLKNGWKSKFDVIVTSEVIEHIPDEKKTAFVQSLSLLLKPKSHIIITTPRKDIKEPFSKKYGKPNQPVEDWLSEQELKRLFIDSGYKVVGHDYAYIMDIYQVWCFVKEN